MSKKESDNSGPENIDPWLLEEVYPSAQDIFTAYPAPDVSQDNVIVALDTNALLLPYRMNPGNLEVLGKVYKDLSDKRRLVVPARAVREFAKHRDKKLGELIQAINDQRKRFPDQLPPLVQDVDGYKEALECLRDLKLIKEKYDKAVGKIIAGMKGWRGNDPVAKLYASVFPADAIVDLPVHDAATKEELLKEARRRTANRVPPGYQDAGKKDEGIGDFLIWKSLLELGKTRKQDLAFVTGEQKNDWFVRSGGEHIYPRFELVDEYRRASSGRSLRLMNLPQLLDALKAPANVVDDAKTAEAQSAAAERAAERRNWNLNLWQALKAVPVLNRQVSNANLEDILASLTSNQGIADYAALAQRVRQQEAEALKIQVEKAAKAAMNTKVEEEANEEEDEKPIDE